MQSKKLLLATAALAALAGASQAQAGGLYVSVFGGANFLADQSELFTSSGTSSVSIDGDTGFAIGAAIGTSLEKWAKGLRAEGEVSYRRNDVGGAWTTNTGSTGGFHDSNMSTFAILANVLYDIDIGSKVRPHVMGGLGWGRSHAEGAFVETFSDGGEPGGVFTDSGDNSGFAWQLGLGFNYEVMPDVDVGIAYRYFNGPRFVLSDFGGEAGNGQIDNQSHAVQVNLTVGIN